MLNSPNRPQIKLNKLENSQSARMSALAVGFACVFLVHPGLATAGNGVNAWQADISPATPTNCSGRLLRETDLGLPSVPPWPPKHRVRLRSTPSVRAREFTA